MTGPLSPDSLSYIQHAVESGAYRDEAQALDEAVELLKQRDQLRRDVRAGIEQADRGELISADKVFERLEKRALEIERNARAQR